MLNKNAQFSGFLISDTMFGPLRFVFTLSTNYGDDEDSHKAKVQCSDPTGGEALTASSELGHGCGPGLVRECRRNGIYLHKASDNKV